MKKCNSSYNVYQRSSGTVCTQRFTHFTNAQNVGRRVWRHPGRVSTIDVAVSMYSAQPMLSSLFEISNGKFVMYTFSYKINRLYYVIGWCVPVVMTTAWAIVTANFLDSECWTGYAWTNYYWILEGPRMAIIAVIYALSRYIEISYKYIL